MKWPEGPTIFMKCLTKQVQMELTARECQKVACSNWTGMLLKLFYVVHTSGAVTTQGAESHYYLFGKEDRKVDEREDSKLTFMIRRETTIMKTQTRISWRMCTMTKGSNSRAGREKINQRSYCTCGFKKNWNLVAIIPAPINFILCYRCLCSYRSIHEELGYCQEACWNKLSVECCDTPTVTVYSCAWHHKILTWCYKIP